MYLPRTYSSLAYTDGLFIYTLLNGTQVAYMYNATLHWTFWSDGQCTYN